MPKLSVDVIIDLVVLAMFFFAGYHVKGWMDDEEKSATYKAQVEANQAAQDIINAKSKQVESDLAAERVKSADLNKKWSEARAKTHTKCILDSNAVSLLRDATASK